MARVPMGRRNLFSEKKRALLSIASVGFAMLLVLALDGIFAGAMRQLTRYIDTLPVSVIVAQSGVEGMHMNSSSLPLEAVNEVRAIPGVTAATPLLFQSTALRAGERQQLTYFIGFEAGQPGGPPSLTEGREPGEGEIVIDKKGAKELDVSLGDGVVALGREWKVAGMTSGLTNMTNTTAFVRFADFEETAGLAGVASYILVGGDVPPRDLAETISRETGLSALGRQDFSASEARLVRDMTADLLYIVTLAAFVIGLVIVALTLYTETIARSREWGVMKALGAKGYRLSAVVLQQGAWILGTALAFALLLSFLFAWAAGRLPVNVTITVTGASVARVAIAGLIIGAVAAVIPLRKIARIDPATVFRR